MQMITLTDPVQESICLDSFLGITKILDEICDNISDDHGRLEDFNDNFIDYVYELYGSVDILYPIMNTRKIEYLGIKNFFLKKINLDTDLGGKKTHNHLQERLNFALVGDYTNNKITVFTDNNSMTTQEITAIGIKPDSCELMYDQPLRPSVSRFNEVVENIKHGVIFVCLDIESYSESLLFKGFKHHNEQKSGLFSGNKNPIYTSHYTNIYIGQWKLDRSGRNIYELGLKPKVTSNMNSREELKKTFEHILSTGEGKIDITITGVERDAE